MTIEIVSGAKIILRALQKYGFEAYVVGGCVRDALSGVTPHDWDICTSATPDEMMRVCDKENLPYLATGLKHGTISIKADDEYFETTTFRVDGAYTDGRHPDAVSFVATVEEDLARRDFTVNAMAYNDERGLVDPFLGEVCLDGKILDCVGDPDTRFHEDGLRVLRALRFMAVKGYTATSSTRDAIHRCRELLLHISSERITSELTKILLAPYALPVLLEYSDVIGVIVPELNPCIGFNQNNRYHHLTIYDHIMTATTNYRGDDLAVKLALFLHDIGKPTCYTEDENGGHFYGHAEPSYRLAKDALSRLRFENSVRDDALELIFYHDVIIEPTRKTVRRWLNKLGEKQLRRLMDVRLADILAHALGTQESRVERRNAVCTLIDELIAGDACFKVKDLKVSGRDIIGLGVKEGPEVGRILNALLDAVISEKIPNGYDELLEYAKNIL